MHDYSRHVESIFREAQKPKVFLVDGGSPFYVKALLDTYHRCMIGETLADSGPSEEFQEVYEDAKKVAHQLL